MTSSKTDSLIRPVAWAMRIPGRDGSADWVELGEEQPEPLPPAVASPLYDSAGMAALARNEVQQMIEDCVPGGSFCDPQQVADALREWSRVRHGPDV